MILNNRLYQLNTLFRFDEVYIVIKLTKGADVKVYKRQMHQQSRLKSIYWLLQQ